MIKEMHIRSEKIQATIPLMVYGLFFSNAVQVVNVMLTSFSSVGEIARK